MRNDQMSLRVEPDYLAFHATGQSPVHLAWPSFQINGRPTANAHLQWVAVGQATLANGCTEYRHVATIGDAVRLMLVVRVAPDSPVVRLRYELSTSLADKLTKSHDADAITYASLSLVDYPDVTEVRLSEWIDFHHSFELNEVPVQPTAFANSLLVMGPMLAAEKVGQSTLLAYEHGSTYPDAFLGFGLTPGREVNLQAVHGNYVDNEPADGFQTVWLLLASVAGTRDDLARAVRHFLLTRQAINNQSRMPYLFYNTWNYQERIKNWNKKPYLEEMTQERMLREIDAAHRIGIDVFVIDTGWFKRTGDWRVNLDRFPDNLKAIKHRLDSYGMKLGLWFDNSAGVESEVGTSHVDCRCSTGGKVWDPSLIWETEPAHRMCLVSRYWEAFANELIRLHKEVGVSYFKWDAIGQYGCTDAHHLHGSADHSEQERGDNYAFKLPLYMARIVETVSQACPEAIVDFDVTETHRAVGLAFLSAGKFFLVNNGPYCWNYNVPENAGWPNGNPNLFFFPGPARTWICRQPLTYDKWVPMNLFLTHYLPDDGATNQVNCVASLILGQNGIWGDLPAISEQGITLLGGLLGKYKQVRDDIAKASPVREGIIGGCPEIHEKINPATGRGAVVIFATNPGTYHYITQARVDAKTWATDGVKTTQLPDGRCSIAATFAGHMGWNNDPSKADWAKIVYFGVEGVE